MCKTCSRRDEETTLQRKGPYNEALPMGTKSDRLGGSMLARERDSRDSLEVKQPAMALIHRDKLHLNK